jgi:hypothetical protein
MFTDSLLTIITWTGKSNDLSSRNKISLFAYNNILKLLSESANESSKTCFNYDEIKTAVQEVIKRIKKS